MIPSDKKLAASYARKSDPNDMGLLQQHAINAEQAQAHGYFIPDDARFRFSDDDTSGATTKRKGLNALLDVITSGHADFSRVYIKDTTREGRFDDPRFHIYLQVLTQQHGVTLCYGDQEEPVDMSDGFDMSKAGALLTDLMRGIAASAERATIRARITDGARSWTSLGFYCNRGVPYGMERVYADERTGAVLGPVDEGRIVRQKGLRFKLRFADDERRQVIAEVYRDLLDGASLASVAKSLNDRSVPSPAGTSTWSPETVRRLATNPIYAGHLEWGRTRRDEPALPPGETPIKGGSAPILMRNFVPDPPVSDEGFQAVQAVLKGRNEDYRRRRRSAPPFLLSGLLHCTCGGRWHGFTSSKESSRSRRRYYRHANPSDATGTCPLAGRYLPAEPLEQSVTELLYALLGDDALERTVQRALTELASANGVAQVEGNLGSLEKEKRGMHESMRRLVADRASASSELEREACQAQIDVLNRRCTELDRQIRVLSDCRTRLEKLSGSLARTAGAAPALALKLSDAEPARRQAVCRLLVQRVRVLDESHLDIVLTPIQP